MITTLVLMSLGPGTLVPAADVLNGLGQRIGMQITVASELRQDLVLVEPRGASVNDQVSAIAMALHASLIKSKDEIKVERTSQDRREMLEESSRVREKWLTGRMDRVSQYRGSYGTASTPQAFFKAAANQAAQLREFYSGKRSSIDQFYPEQTMPFQGMLESLIDRVGRKRLAKIESGTSEVFTSDGSLGTQKLPSCEDLLRSYESAMEPFREAVKSETDAGTLRALPHLAKMVESWPTRSPVTRLRLIVQSTEGGLLLAFSGYNGAGKKLFETYFDAGPTDGSHTPLELLRASAEGKQPAQRKLSATAASAMKFLTKGGDDLPEWVSNPDKSEPLNQFVIEGVDSLIAREAAKPSVFVASDSLLKTVSDCVVGGEINVDALGKAIVEWSDYERIDSEGWSIWRPRDLRRAEAFRANRNVLARFVSEFERNGPKFRALCLMYAQASEIPRGLSNLWESLLDRKRGRIAFSGESPFLLSALGHLSDGAWKELSGGQTMTLQKAGIADEVKRWFGFDCFRTAQLDVAASDWEQFPLSSLSLAELARSPLDMLGSRAKLFRSWTGDVEVEGGAPIETLSQRFIAFLPGDVDRSGAQWVLKVSRQDFEKRLQAFKFRLCEQDEWNVRLSLSNQRYLHSTIRGEFVPTSEVLTFSSLPENMRAAIWDTACAFNLDPKNASKIVTSVKSGGE